MPGEGLLGSSAVWDSSRGEFINEKHRRIAEILADYDPDLRLLYIPPADRLPTDTQPFAVGYVRAGQEPQIVRFCAEEEIDERLLAEIFMNDTRVNDPLRYWEKLEAAKRILKMKEDLERREEGMEIAQWMINTPRHTIQLGKGQVLHT